MAAPLDEGPPTFTNQFPANTINGANFCTAFRVWTMDEATGDDADKAVLFPTIADIHNENTFGFTPAASGTELTRELRILNALSYHNMSPPAILSDLIQDQAHAGRGVLRMVPNGDHGTNQFTRSSGALAHYEYVDELSDAADSADYLETTTVGQLEQFELPSLPSNAVRIHEAICNAWIQLRKGTDTSVSFQVYLFTSGAASITVGNNYLWVKQDDTLRLAQLKLYRLDTTAATWATSYMQITARRGAAGGTPNPRWRLVSVDLMAYYSVSDVEIVNSASFSAQAINYTSYQLDMSMWDGTFRSQILDILKHAPELHVYSDYLGRLSLGRVKAYSSVSSPLDLTDSILSVRKGPYKYRQRTANQALVKWGVSVSHTGTGAAAEDPVNSVPDRGDRRTLVGSTWVLKKGHFNPKDLDRHYIRSGPLALYMGDTYAQMWGDDVDAVEIECDMRAIEAEPGDVVKVNRPDLGMTARKFCVADKTLNLDRDVPVLTLYDVEFTKANYS